jgi:epoxyqueuosine reductase
VISLEASPKERILVRAKDIGFDIVGVTTAGAFSDVEPVFKQRVADGLLANWSYPDETVERVCRPELSLPGAKSIICTATSYLTEFEPHDPYAPGLKGAVSAHAWGRDYHRTIGDRLRRLAAFVVDTFPGERCVPCVDTGPMVDRAAAVRAGIGWFGKNANVLTREFGSWVLLGELVTTLELPPDEPLMKSCGQCVECIARCPTGAIGSDGRVDGRRCISDLTQLKSPIPRELRASIGNRLWGCDDCQTVCPVNERKSLAAKARAREEFAPLPHVGVAMDLPAVLHMTKSQFRAWFGPTSMAWRGKAVLQRNAAVALGNSRDPQAVEPLIYALADGKALVRGHAAWALGRLREVCTGELVARARAALLELQTRETDAWVREEIGLALERFGDEAQESA